MAYYHVYVEYYLEKGPKARPEECHEKDYTNKDDIIEKFVKPFMSDDIFFVSGRVIRPGTVNIFRVLESEVPLSSIVAKINNDVPHGLIIFYDEDDVLKGQNSYGLKDVTYDFVKNI